MSHGSEWNGGDKDIAVTREKPNASTSGAETTKWNLLPGMAPFYKFPGNLNQLPPITAYTGHLDAMDGADRRQMARQQHRAVRQRIRHSRTNALSDEALRRRHQDRRVRARQHPRSARCQHKAIDVIGHAFSGG